MGHDLVELGAILIVVIAYRALPEAAVAGRDVQVPRLAPELLGIRRAPLRLRVPLGLYVPAVQDREARACIAEPGREIDHAVGFFHGSPAARDPGDVLVDPRHLLDDIFGAGRQEQRSKTGEQRLLGHTRRAIRGTHRRIGRGREHERSTGGGK